MGIILVVCGAGASSTFLVHWMRREAISRSLPVTIEAGTAETLETRLRDVRVILVSHHLSTLFPGIERTANDAGVDAYLLPVLPFDAVGAMLALDIASVSFEPIADSSAAQASTTNQEISWLNNW